MQALCAAALSPYKAHRAAKRYPVAGKAERLVKVSYTNRNFSTGAVNLGTTLFPSVQRLLHEYSLKFEALAKLGSGPKGRVTKGDVLNYIRQKNLSPSPQPHPAISVSSSEGASSTSKSSSSGVASQGAFRRARRTSGPAAFEDLPTDNMRRVIAYRLTVSKTTVPHGYATREIDLEALSVLRKKLNGAMGETGKLTVTDFLVRASALSLKHVPEANAQWDVAKKEIVILNNIDISVAVALESGLITPILAGADKKGLAQLSSETKDLVSRARNKGLKPHEYQGGTFSISNLGMFGISEFSAVINPPQAMILAVGGPIPKVAIDSQAFPVPATTMKVTLSYDTRAISPDIAAQWLDTFNGFLTKPTSMML